MAENTAITWATDTFNPWEGCQKVSPACDGCYAEARNARYAGQGGIAPNWGPGAPRRRTVPSNWAKPLKWEREQAALWTKATIAGDHMPAPRFVFCASMADVFDNAVPAEWLADLFALARKTPHLTYLFLTKRPQNSFRLWFKACGSEGWPPNVALGTTVEDRDRLPNFDRLIENANLIEQHCGTRPAFLFGSCEPLLEDLGDLSPYLGAGGLDWVITGGETDQGKHKARPVHIQAERSIRDQCAAAGVPYHRKQAGEWLCFDANDPRVSTDPITGSIVVEFEGRRYAEQAVVAWNFPYPVVAAKVGKKAAGRMLDGVIHDARPEGSC